MRRCGETPLGQQGSPDRGNVSLPGLKRLCVGPEVLSSATCLCQRKTDGMSDTLGIKFQKMAARRGRTDRSHRCGHMPTARIVSKIKRPTQLAACLEADHVGADNAYAFDMTSFGERNKTRKKRDARMATHR